MSKLPVSQRRDVLAYLQRHDALARVMATTVSPDDKITAVYDLFDKLRTPAALSRWTPTQIWLPPSAWCTMSR